MVSWNLSSSLALAWPAVLPAWAAAALLAAAPAGGEEREKAARVKLDAVPQQFELWQDAEGFLWQVNRQGILGSAEASYFQGAMALVVKGVAFAPEDAWRLDGGQATDQGARLLLTQAAGELKISREIWFDRARAGVRVLDTFENAGARQESYRVELKSAYQNPWQDLHGSDGRILGPGPGAALGPRDFGVTVKFSMAEGRHDTLFLTSGERDALRPLVTFSSNLRELTFTYDLDIAPGESASLLHWVAQRNLRAAGDAAEALRPFYRRRQLVDPGASAEVAARVRNFDAQAFAADVAAPREAGGLVALHAVLEPLGLSRRGGDLLWISRDNQLPGRLNPVAKVKAATAWGQREAGAGEIAAIQGGGGSGRSPRVYLRDGRVWAGAVEMEGLSFEVEEGWEMEDMKLEDLNLLLAALEENDGSPPQGAGLMLALRSGEVLAADGSGTLSAWTPWGELTLPWAEVRELRYESGPSAPRFRLRREDGSLLTVFLGDEDLEIREAGGGEAMTLAASAVAGAWRAGDSWPQKRMAALEEWRDLEEAASWLGEEFPAPAVLLAGNNLLRGTLASQTLHLVSDAAVIPVDPAEIAAMRRESGSGPGAAPSFVVELSSGEILTGQLRERIMEVESGGQRWRVPAIHFLACQNAVAP